MFFLHTYHPLYSPFPLYKSATTTTMTN